MTIKSENSCCDPDTMSSAMATTYRQWRADRGTAPGPNWKSVDLARLPTEIIPLCALIDIRGEGPENMIYRYWGTKRILLNGEDMTGRSVADVRPTFIRDRVMAEFREALATRAPVYVVTTIQRHRGPVTYEALRAPLSANGSDITGMFSAVLFVGDVFMTNEILFEGIIPD